MITARSARDDGTETIFIGLSGRDIELLRGSTLVLNRARVGMSMPETLEIVIAYGSTDQIILDALRNTGALPTHAVTNQKEPM